MDDIATIASFLGWCSILNVGLLVYMTIMLTIFRNPVKKIHSRISGVEQAQLDGIYFNFLGNYKLAIIVLNIVPYFALKILA